MPVGNELDGLFYPWARNFRHSGRLPGQCLTAELSELFMNNSKHKLSYATRSIGAMSLHFHRGGEPAFDYFDEVPIPLPRTSSGGSQNGRMAGSKFEVQDVGRRPYMARVKRPELELNPQKALLTRFTRFTHCNKWFYFLGQVEPPVHSI